MEINCASEPVLKTIKDGSHEFKYYFRNEKTRFAF